MQTNPQVEAKLPEFLAHLQKLIDVNYPSGSGMPQVVMMEGSKFIKIIRQYPDGSMGRSVHCFIDKATGNILKAASWNAPAKHPRGNILVDFTGVGAYGADYLK
jgi:hypothetical protein